MTKPISMPTAPTMWVDTNVILEIFSHADLIRETEISSPSHVLEGRRLRLQGSLWLAMALSRSGTTSISYEHESIKSMLRINPVDGQGADWTRLILYCASDGGVFDGWEQRTTNDAEDLTNEERDDFIVESCTSGLIFISRDEKARLKASERGVAQYTPEDFARTIISFDEARDMFQQRMLVAGKRYIESFPLSSRLIVEANVARFFEFYMNVIWAPAGSIEYND